MSSWCRFLLTYWCNVLQCRVATKSVGQELFYCSLIFGYRNPAPQINSAFRRLTNSTVAVILYSMDVDTIGCTVHMQLHSQLLTMPTYPMFLCIKRQILHPSFQEKHPITLHIFFAYGKIFYLPPKMNAESYWLQSANSHVFFHAPLIASTFFLFSCLWASA